MYRRVVRRKRREAVAGDLTRAQTGSFLQGASRIWPDTRMEEREILRRETGFGSRKKRRVGAKRVNRKRTWRVQADDLRTFLARSPVARAPARYGRETDHRTPRSAKTNWSGPNVLERNNLKLI